VLYSNATKIVKRMGHLVAMKERLTAKAEVNTNAWREGNKANREATEGCLEKAKVETDANRKKMKASREAVETIKRGWSPG
jgi:hypothetical protein